MVISSFDTCVLLNTVLVKLQELPGIPKLRAGVNPATWMLEISTPAAEQRLKLDFAEAYRTSELYRYAAAVCE